MDQHIIYVGLDMHKDTIAIAPAAGDILLCRSKARGDLRVRRPRLWWGLREWWLRSLPRGRLPRRCVPSLVREGCSGVGARVDATGPRERDAWSAFYRTTKGKRRLQDRNSGWPPSTVAAE
jgi:hypothetical protein